MHSKSQNHSNEELFVDKFVGREQFLAIVDEAIADVPNCHIFRFVGEGGAGKTALLRKIYKIYEGSNDIIVTWLDYNKSEFQIFPTLASRWVEQITKQGIVINLNAFHKKLDKLRQAFLHDNDEVVTEKENHAYIDLLRETNQALQDKRLLILSDSVEASSQVALSERMNNFGVILKNTVIVLAGRPESDVINYYKHQVSNTYKDAGWSVHDIEIIQQFSIEDTYKYFNKYLSFPLEPELIETIHVLTEGKPILLALTMEWFKHYVDLPRHVNRSKEELEAFESLKLRMFRKHFKMALVRRVRAVRSPLDKALLFLSFLDRRYDKRILQLALNRPMEYIEELEPQLRQMAFIRSFLDDSSGLLHEEAKNLINEYAWPPYDPKRTDRKKLARKVIDGFYLPEIEKLRSEAATKDASDVPTQLSAHELEMECLDYHYRISLDEGRRYVTRLIDEGVSLRKREGMRHEITRRVGQHEAKVAVARLELRRGQLEGVREVLEEALKDEELSDWYRMTLEHELSQAE